jgi:hypothetical protein
MSNQIVHRYRVLCIAENKMVTAYGEEPPLLCPNDHVDRSLDHSRTIMADTFKKNQVEIFDPTDGNFQYRCIHFSVPSGSPPGEVTPHDFSWPMDLKIWKVEFIPGSEHVGDMVDVIIDPDREIATLTADASINDTELVVASTAFDYPYLTRGIEVKLDDTVNTENVGMITAIDRVNFKLHVETPLTQNFSIGTKICVNVKMVKDAMINQASRPYVVGQKGFKSKELDANTTMRFNYKNNDGQPKDVYVEMEYNYV